MIYKVPMVIADEYVHVAYGPVRVVSVHGFNNNAADRYLQFHEKFPDALTNGDVPTFKSMWFPQGAQTVFGRETFGDGGLTFSELLAAISSTEVNYTAVTNTGLDLTIVVETEHYIHSGITIVGDLTTPDAERELWSNAAGPKRLLRMDSLMGSDAFPIIQARGGALDATYATRSLRKCINGEVATFLFGPGGGQFEENVAGTIYRGCSVGWVDAIGGYLSSPFTVATSPDQAMRFVYEDA
jgi:hypothetical protein